MSRISRIVAALFGLAIAVSLTPLRAQAAPPPKPPAAAAAAQIEASQTIAPRKTSMDKRFGSVICNPQNKKKYCTPNSDDYWSKYLAKARKDAKKHKSAKWRRNVPFPNINTLYSRLDGFGAVYVVTGRPAGGGIGPVAPENSVYKFGMTRQNNLGLRPLASLAQCKRDKRWVQCKVQIVAFTRYQNGGYHARWLEAAMITRYVRSTGHCPPGAPSCR